MKLKENIKEAIDSGFAGIWLKSHEHEDALKEIAQVCQEENWTLLTWDSDFGLRSEDPQLAAKLVRAPDALSALTSFRKIADAKPDERNTRAVLVMRNFHGSLLHPNGVISNYTLLQLTQHVIELGFVHGLHLVVLSYPGIRIPLELEKMVLVIEHELPDADELMVIADEMDTNHVLPRGNTAEFNELKDAARGLTRLEAAGAFGLSLFRHREFKPDAIWEMKIAAVKQSGLIEVRRPKAGFDSLGGLSGLKQYWLDTVINSKPDADVYPLGVLLMGIPGVAKSKAVDALGFETGRPVLDVNMGALKGGIIGQSEQQTKAAINLIIQTRPCIVRLD